LSEIYPDFIDNPMKWIRAYVDSFDDTKTDFFEQSKSKCSFSCFISNW